MDRAPPGLIRADTVARYNKFFPKDDNELWLRRWVNEIRRNLPIEAAIDDVQSRLQTASDDEQPILKHILGGFLIDVGRYDEALSVFDSAIELQPDHVRSAIAKAALYLRHRDEPERALQAIDFALERALRTKSYRRQALGVKARILIKLQRGPAVGQVLEQIMSLQMFPDVRDIARERDFVDCAPLGLIPEDIVARYNEFCPKVDEDLP